MYCTILPGKHAPYFQCFWWCFIALQYICSLSRSGQDHNKEVASNIIFHNPTTSNMSSNTSTAREERTENFEEGLNSPLPSSRPNEADVDVDGLVVAVLENANYRLERALLLQMMKLWHPMAALQWYRLRPDQFRISLMTATDCPFPLWWWCWCWRLPRARVNTIEPMVRNW